MGTKNEIWPNRIAGLGHDEAAARKTRFGGN